MSTIKIENVSKTYEDADGNSVNALSNINLTINDGEFVSIVGPSGCGKSTLLEIVAGLQKQTEGAVYLDDKPVTGPGRDIGVVFQSAALFPWRTVRRNMAYGMEIAKVPKDEQKERIDRYLDLMGLKDFADKYPSQLSGGMRQRAGIARTLIMNPKVTLMDEPFSAVDHLTRSTLQEELIRIHQKEKKTVLFVTHDISEAVLLSDRIILLTPRPGKIQQEYVVKTKQPRSRTDDEIIKISSQIITDISRGADIKEAEYFI